MPHKRLLAAAVLVLAAASSSSALAGWGCAFGATDEPGVHGRRWGYASEQEARDTAMRGCKADNWNGCRIIGCRADVNNKEDADKLWPMKEGAGYYTCGNGKPKC